MVRSDFGNIQNNNRSLGVVYVGAVQQPFHSLQAYGGLFTDGGTPLLGHLLVVYQ
jgi:hypothetical protein